MRLALFDFCNTIADFSTADAYIEYVLKNINKKERRHRTWKHDFLRKIKIVWMHDLLVSRRILRNSMYLNKRLYLDSIAGISYEDMNQYASDYYEEKIRPHIVKLTISELRARKNEGFRIGVVSGGYDLYLKYFTEEYGIDDLICTHIGFDNQKATGKIDGIDCMNEKKVVLLESYYEGMEVDREASYVYSDSRSDLPLLTWAGNGVVVAKNTEPEWARENGLRCLIWEE